MTAKSGREPGLAEIAKELDISCEEVAACMGAGAEIESLYRESGNGE
ncbi:MAG: sigma-70 domain-containing protein [Clostridium sp.]